jgi:hypothetical protein
LCVKRGKRPDNTHIDQCRHVRSTPAIVSLRAAGGFGEKPKQDAKTVPMDKVSADEKAADPKQALDADLEAMRKAMGGDGGSTTIKQFGDDAMEPSVPERQVH